MSEDKYDDPVIQFYLSIGYASANHSVWVKAPKNWDDMSERDRDEFVNEQAEQWANEKIEYSGTVYYASPDEAREATKGSLVSAYHDSELEEWFD